MDGAPVATVEGLAAGTTEAARDHEAAAGDLEVGAPVVASATAEVASAPAEESLALAVAAEIDERVTVQAATTAATTTAAAAVATATTAALAESAMVSTAAATTATARSAHRRGGSADEGSGAEAIDEAAVVSRRSVQHVGTWLLMAVVASSGLHAEVARLWGKRAGAAALRIALDAVIAALAIGQRCVEGVRRLATPTASALLRAQRPPSASWVRRLLGRFVAAAGGTSLHLAMAQRWMQQARDADEDPVVFYVDGHMRRYRWQHTVRRGRRMQDQRVLPGAATDYYVHDQDGRPVLRVDVPSHDSLTAHLSPIAELLRSGLGDTTRLLLAFDRGGAYPSQLVDLRDRGVEFVTYERRPYPLLMAPSFDRTVVVRDETIAWTEPRLTNLGGGRGRVRRISLRRSDGKQINLLAVSSAPAERLIAVLLGDAEGGGRWLQENAFKHGAERWGINQLDGRTVDPHDPATVIPNPARRRIDRALALARVREGHARRQLARYSDDDPRRRRAERDLEEAMVQQLELEALRPLTPKHAPLEDTELAGQLVRHRSDYKTVLDTIRIACAHAESDLAAELAPHLARPAEAKKALANLFAAPGDVYVTCDRIRVTLRPAGTTTELAALVRLCNIVNRWRLTLPDDPQRHRLVFACQGVLISAVRSLGAPG